MGIFNVLELILIGAVELIGMAMVVVGVLAILWCFIGYPLLQLHLSKTRG